MQSTVEICVYYFQVRGRSHMISPARSAGSQALVAYAAPNFPVALMHHLITILTYECVQLQLPAIQFVSGPGLCCIQVTRNNFRAMLAPSIIELIQTNARVDSLELPDPFRILLLLLYLFLL